MLSARQHVNELLSALTAVALSYAIHVQFFNGEENLTGSLAEFLGRSWTTKEHAPPITSASELLTLLLSALFSVVAMRAWSKLDATACKVVTLQLVALVLIIQTVGIFLNAPMNNILALNVAAIFGIAYGTLAKSLMKSNVSTESNVREIESLRRELLESKLQMIKEDEVERRVLAGDLHDQVLNDLKVVKNKIAASEGLDREARQELDKLIVDSMHQIREVMDSLSPAVLEHLGFAAAIEDCIRVGCDKGNLKVRFKSEADDAELKFLSPTDQTLIYRLVQESVTNIRKHADAKTVRGKLTIDGGTLIIEVSDDGVGFDPTTKPSDSRGLRYMRQRASIIGAKVDWKSGDEGKGTRVVISMPVESTGTVETQ